MPNGSGMMDCGHCVFNDACEGQDNWKLDRNHCTLRGFVPENIGYTRCANFTPGEFESLPEKLPETDGPIIAILHDRDYYIEVPWVGLAEPCNSDCVSCSICGRSEGEKSGISIELDGSRREFCTSRCYETFVSNQSKNSN